MSQKEIVNKIERNILDEEKKTLVKYDNGTEIEFVKNNSTPLLKPISISRNRLREALRRKASEQGHRIVPRSRQIGQIAL